MVITIFISKEGICESSPYDFIYKVKALSKSVVASGRFSIPDLSAFSSSCNAFLKLLLILFSYAVAMFISFVFYRCKDKYKFPIIQIFHYVFSFDNNISTHT